MTPGWVRRHSAARLSRRDPWLCVPALRLVCPCRAIVEQGTIPTKSQKANRACECAEGALARIESRAGYADCWAPVAGSEALPALHEFPLVPGVAQELRERIARCTLTSPSRIPAKSSRRTMLAPSDGARSGSGW